MTTTPYQNEKSPESETVLRIEHLKKYFGNNHVLEDFSLELKKNRNIVVLGKSGSGKSVLIKCIIGLLQPDAGFIEVFGKNVWEMSAETLDKTRARVGFLFQSNALYDSMTVKDNLEFPLRRQWIHHSQAEIDEMVMQVLSDVNLAQTLHMMPIELSGGMRKRIALARTLILKPDIILYDEPTTGLDPVTGKEIIQLMVDIKKKYGTAALIISHDINCVKYASDEVVVLVNGICYAKGTYEELKQNEDKNVRQFFE